MHIEWRFLFFLSDRFQCAANENVWLWQLLVVLQTNPSVGFLLDSDCTEKLEV